jgi:phosphoribosylformylglycinamidine synthase
MLYRIEVGEKPGIFDAIGEGIKKDILDLGIKAIEGVRFIQVYLIEGALSQRHLELICQALLADPITQMYCLQKPLFSAEKNQHLLEIAYNPGVMDPWQESVKKAISDLKITPLRQVRTAKKYLLEGNLSQKQIQLIVDKILANKVIQHPVKAQRLKSLKAEKGITTAGFRRQVVEILNAEEKQLEEISKTRQLYLNLAEMKQIQQYFQKLRRQPSDIEIETIAQTWSEHCVHKTFRGRIEYSEVSAEKSKSEVIDDLLKSTIMKVTKELAKSWCVSVFQDNSGVIRFDEKNNVCFKVETHNHPSALEPYGGAGTGIGGVIRDPLGTGLGAKPILNTDVFCFAAPDFPFEKLPKGILHPKRIMKGVVAGVRDYGNRMGIPTANGAVLFDERFLGNPLVYCGNLGILPKGKSFKKVKKGQVIVLVGGRTGRDGIHGATFSSGELTHESEATSAQAVQIGNPITEKKLTDVLLKSRDLNLYSAITDCGAGGLSSAVGEMARHCGAKVYLEKVPLKYAGLSYTEIWISEAQERMVLAVAKNKLKKLLKLFASEDVEATPIGEVTSDKRLKLYYQKNPVGDLEMKFLHEGLPHYQRQAIWKTRQRQDPKLEIKTDYTEDLLKLLCLPNIASKEWIIRQYDHEVQGQSVLKPLTGIANDGPSDGCVIRPVLEEKKGLAIACGINFLYGDIDPYWMACANIDEALRNIVACGGALEKTALLDNFCWGNTDKPEQLGALVRAARGCYFAAKEYGVPFISGKDSLNNEFSLGKKGRTISIPGTLLISAISVVDNVEQCVSMDFKEAGNPIYLVGLTKAEMGGSHYLKLLNSIGASVPALDAKLGKKIFAACQRAITSGVVRACHDLSEGGLAVALAEMCFAGGLGAAVFLEKVPYQREKKQKGDFAAPILLFAESNSRFLIEVDKDRQRKFEKIMQGVPFALIGTVCKDPELKIHGRQTEELIVRASVPVLKEAWQRTFKW